MKWWMYVVPLLVLAAAMAWTLTLVDDPMVWCMGWLSVAVALLFVINIMQEIQVARIRRIR